VNLVGGNGKGTGGVVKGIFHPEGGFVLFAFEEPDAAKTCEDLGIAGTVFGQGCFILGIERKRFCLLLG